VVIYIYIYIYIYTVYVLGFSQTRIVTVDYTLLKVASVLTRATRRNIPEDAILYSHRREDLKSYKWHLVTSADRSLVR
jgi:hypothetical protein